jgi:protocatechuate 3,4-dioxygenase beta subunit
MPVGSPRSMTRTPASSSTSTKSGLRGVQLTGESGVAQFRTI